MTPLLQLQDIKKTYNLRKVLKGVNLELTSTEIFVLFGPNGAGKTTLLKIASGLMKPSEGTVRLKGVPLRGTDGKKVFYLGHNNCLYKDLTVLENIRFFHNLWGNHNTGYSLKDVLEEFGLWQRRTDPVKTLSQGMKRRLALLKAMLTGAEMIIMDEPMTGLDLIWRERILDRLLELKKRGKTILMVTHLVDEAMKVADRIGMLSNGRIEFIKDKNSITEQEIIQMLKTEARDHEVYQ